MDTAQFGQLSHIVAASATRRSLTRLHTTLPVVGASGLLAEEAARRQRYARPPAPRLQSPR
jgi:hypothetical protein